MTDPQVDHLPAVARTSTRGRSAAPRRWPGSARPPSSRCSPRTASPAGCAARPTWSRRSASSRTSTRRPGPFSIEGAEPGDTAGRPLHLDRAGPGLGRVHHRAAVRRAERHPRHRAAARPAAGAGLALAVRHRARACAGSPPAAATSPRTCRSSPMHGTVGVAPANLEVRSALVPDAFGGNMDTPEMRAGVDLLPGRERRGRAVRRSATGTPARARARPAGSRWSAR